MSSTRDSPPASMGNCTAMPGNTTMSSRGTSLRDAMKNTIRSIVDVVNHSSHQVNWAGHEEPSAGVWGVGAADSAAVEPARAAAGPGSGARAVPGAVPRALRHRTGEAGADEAAGGVAVVRRVQRDRTGGSAGGARARAPRARHGRPAREGARP